MLHELMHIIWLTHRWCFCCLYITCARHFGVEWGCTFNSCQHSVATDFENGDSYTLMSSWRWCFAVSGCSQICFIIFDLQIYLSRKMEKYKVYICSKNIYGVSNWVEACQDIILPFMGFEIKIRIELLIDEYYAILLKLQILCGTWITTAVI